MYLSVILIVEVVKGVKIIDLRHFKTFYSFLFILKRLILLVGFEILSEWTFLFR